MVGSVGSSHIDPLGIGGPRIGMVLSFHERKDVAALLEKVTPGRPLSLTPAENLGNLPCRPLARPPIR